MCETPTPNDTSVIFVVKQAESRIKKKRVYLTPDTFFNLSA